MLLKGKGNRCKKADFWRFYNQSKYDKFCSVFFIREWKQRQRNALYSTN